jgi:Na+-driven multidrug efflux pump
VNFISQSDAVRSVMMGPMRIMGIVTPIIAVAMILSEALFGAGNTRFVAAAQLVLIFGVLVPGARFLGITMHWGLNGIWTAACVYAILAAIVMTFKFRMGGWKRIRL